MAHTKQSQTLSGVETLLDRWIDEGHVVGAVSLIAQHGHIAHIHAAGMADVELKQTMSPDTIFRIYSLTKPVAAAATLMLYEEGRFLLTDPISRFLPLFSAAKVFKKKDGQNIQTEALQREITIHDLLTHTAGIGRDALFGTPVGSLYREADLTNREKSLADVTQQLATLPLLHQPGKTWDYSLSTDVLAHLVEVVSDMSFAEFVRQRIFQPLGMNDTGYYVPDHDGHRLASVYDTMQKPPKKVEAAETSPYRQEPSLYSGSAGLVSTVSDYYRFAQCLLNKGEWENQRILQAETVTLMTTNQLSPHLLPYALPWQHTKHYTVGYGFGYGVRVRMDTSAGNEPGSEGEFGWAGAKNTYLWVDPKKQLVLLLFMQADPFMYGNFDRQFKERVYATLTD